MFYSLFHLFSHAACRYTQSFYSRSAFRAPHTRRSLNARASFCRCLSIDLRHDSARHNFIACYSRDVPRLSGHQHTHTRTHACMHAHTHTYVRITHCTSHVALTSNQLHRLLLSRRASPLQSSPVPSSRARVTYTTHRSHTHVTLLHSEGHSARARARVLCAYHPSTPQRSRPAQLCSTS